MPRILSMASFARAIVSPRARRKLMEAGKPYLFTIDLWATSNVFLPGHRIRLEISSSNFPRFDRNLNTGEPFGEGTKGILHVRRYFIKAIWRPTCRSR